MIGTNGTETRQIRSDELRIGDMLKLWCGNYRVTGFQPYTGPLACITRIVCVEGCGPFISDDGTGWEVYTR